MRLAVFILCPPRPRNRARCISVTPPPVILAQGGMSTFATLRERLESSEAGRSELESSEARLKRGRVAEEIQEIVAKVQVGTLGLFQKLVAKNEDKPQALKALLPRFVDYQMVGATGLEPVTSWV